MCFAGSLLQKKYSQFHAPLFQFRIWIERKRQVTLLLFKKAWTPAGRGNCTPQSPRASSHGPSAGKGVGAEVSLLGVEQYFPKNAPGCTASSLLPPYNNRIRVYHRSAATRPHTARPRANNSYFILLLIVLYKQSLRIVQEFALNTLGMLNNTNRRYVFFCNAARRWPSGDAHRAIINNFNTASLTTKYEPDQVYEVS